jgi:single-strand DNA-binding protein
VSKSVNQVTLLGNVGQPPESKKLQNGTSLTMVSIATNERKKNGSEWIDHTEWHSVVCFGRLAEIAAQYVRKGSKVYICGRLRTTSWEDGHQVKRWKTNIVADDLILLDRSESAGARPPDESYAEAF